jgi:hypothetical protein
MKLNNNTMPPILILIAILPSHLSPLQFPRLHSQHPYHKASASLQIRRTKKLDLDSQHAIGSVYMNHSFCTHMDISKEKRERRLNCKSPLLSSAQLANSNPAVSPDDPTSFVSIELSVKLIRNIRMATSYILLLRRSGGYAFVRL